MSRDDSWAPRRVGVRPLARAKTPTTAATRKRRRRDDPAGQARPGPMAYLLKTWHDLHRSMTAGEVEHEPATGSHRPFARRFFDAASAARARDATRTFATASATRATAATGASSATAADRLERGSRAGGRRRRTRICGVAHIVRINTRRRRVRPAARWLSELSAGPTARARVRVRPGRAAGSAWNVLRPGE